MVQFAKHGNKVRRKSLETRISVNNPTILMYMCIIFVKERDPFLTAVNVVLEEKLVEIMKGDSFFLI